MSFELWVPPTPPTTPYHEPANHNSELNTQYWAEGWVGSFATHDRLTELAEGEAAEDMMAIEIENTKIFAV